jgi:pimeloyl-ACP methyl ester carboxylesterase
MATIYDGLDADVETFRESPISSLQIREQRADIFALRQKLSGRPVLVHVFSMNGAMSFLKTLTDDRLDLRPDVDLRGIIFDSSPGRMSLGALPEPLGNAMFPRNRFLAAAATFIIRPIFRLYCLAFDKGQKDIDWFTRGFFGRPFNVPTLVLASERDTTLAPADMREYAESVARAGAPVETHFWPDSQHVRLFKDHRKEYTDIVRKFAEHYLLSPQ